MRDLIVGALVLGIGLYTGTSTFQGNFSVMSVFFDVFSIFFIGRGLRSVYKSRTK